MTNIYSEIYNLIIGLFGGAYSPSFARDFCELLSLFGVVFVILVPFIIVIRIIRLITG